MTHKSLPPFTPFKEIKAVGLQLNVDDLRRQIDFGQN